MTNTTINVDVLHSEQVAAYLAKSDRRIRSGFRAALELLDIPLPPAAFRIPPGYKPTKLIAASFAADTAIHGDKTFTPAGNRRIGSTLPPSRFGIPRPESVQRTRDTYSELFGPRSASPSNSQSQ